MLFNPRFPYCVGNIKQAKVAGFVSLPYWCNAIRAPKKKTIELIQNIRAAAEAGKESEKAALKERLPSVTPAVYIPRGQPRRYANIKSFTGILMLDFDKIDDAPELRDYLFDTYPFIVATWLSSSGKGCRAAVRVPQSESTDEFKARYKAIAKEMNQYQGFDMAPQNSVLPLYYSIDPDIKFDLWRDDVFEQKVTPQPPQPQPVRSWYEPSNSAAGRVKNIIAKAIDKITDNGHPQLRAAAFVLGGYVGSGYLDQMEATSHIHGLIESNGYLSQKPDVYKKTAKTMIEKGISKPLYLQGE